MHSTTVITPTADAKYWLCMLKVFVCHENFLSMFGIVCYSVHGRTSTSCRTDSQETLISFTRFVAVKADIFVIIINILTIPFDNMQKSCDTARTVGCQDFFLWIINAVRVFSSVRNLSNNLIDALGVNSFKGLSQLRILWAHITLVI
jgi:hypothetical protein